ncbi:unnamed protein product [Notodromas monacha]|uniref:Protein HIRA n=1 Tax=Notodromas monacha TaxID=399045 RepID=A0A7R9BLN3_9CRUS|nr:unnamed protein product [Notodromas monacha]CAG0916956.1 unnamed protein product [Notodromas monacha]
MQLLKPPWVSHNGNPIISVDIHPDQTRFATGGQDGDAGRVSIWSMAPLQNVASEESESVSKLLYKMDNHLACVNSVRWSPTGRWLASGGDDKLVIIWQMSREAPMPVFGGDGRAAAETWRALTLLQGHMGDVLDLAWSPKEHQLASCSVDNSIIIWDTRKWGEKVVVLRGHTSLVKGVSWDPVGKFLASQSDDKTLRIWRCQDWKCHKVISEPFEETSGATHVLRLHWSPDGQALVSAFAKNGGWPTAQIIRREGFELFNDFVGHRKAVTCVKFNPQLFQDVVELDVPNGDAVQEDADQHGNQKSETNGTTEAGKISAKKAKKQSHVNPEYLCCALGSRDHGLSIWLTKIQRPRIVLESLFSDSVTDLSWSANGLELMASSWDGTIAFISFEPSELGRSISMEERSKLMRKYYGSFAMDSDTGEFGLKSIQSQIMENPMSEPDITKFNEENSLNRGFGDASSSPSSAKVVIKGPTDKQIETRTTDGRRRITPIFIPVDLGPIPQPFGTPSSTPHVDENGSRPGKMNGFPAVPSDHKREKVQSKSEKSADDETSLSSSSSSSDNESTSSEEDNEVEADSERQGEVDKARGDIIDAVKGIVEPDVPKEEKLEESTASTSSGSSDSDDDDSSSSSSSSSDDGNEPVITDQQKKLEPAESRVEQADDSDECAEEDVEMKDEKSSSESEEEVQKSSGMSRKRKLESSEDEAVNEAEEVEPDVAEPEPCRTKKSVPRPSTRKDRPETVPETLGVDDLLGRRIGTQEKLAPSSPVPPKPDEKPRGGILIRIPSTVTSPGLSLQAENFVYTSAGKAVHRIKCKPEGTSALKHIAWEELYSSPITHVALTSSLAVVVCSDGMLNCHDTVCGDYVIAPLKLAGAALKLIAKDSLVAVLTKNAVFCLWNMSSKRNLVRSDVGHLFTNPQSSVSVLMLTDDGAPVIGLTSGKAYVFSTDLQSWALVCDSSDTVKNIAHPSAVRNASSSGGIKKSWGYGSRDLPILLGIQEQLKRNVSGASQLFRSTTEMQHLGTMSYLNSQMAAAKLLNSPRDFKECLVNFVRYCVQNGLEIRLRQVFDDLLGPIFGRKSSAQWQEEIVGLNKRQLLKEVLPLVSSNLALQRLHVEYTDLLNCVGKGGISSLREVTPSSVSNSAMNGDV